MIEKIADADIAIVDITNSNPNVFYELGVRHTLKRGITVLIRHEGFDPAVPFNVGGLNVIDYDVSDPSDAARRIRETLTASLARQGHIDSLVFGMLTDLRVTPRVPRTAPRTRKTIYRIGDSDRQIGFVTGDLACVRGVDAWVNSENTRMEMARIDEQAVSATIRYRGAARDDAKNVVNDAICDELIEKTGGAPVPPGQVVATAAGELTATNDVKWIIHAASVIGQPGKGFTLIPDVTQCVTNALEEADVISVAASSSKDEGIRSILFPLFGTGQAGRDAEDQFARLVEVALAHFERVPASHVQEVLFLAYTDQQEKLCGEVLETWPNDELRDATTRDEPDKE
jgi:O-acetyl-ADP-ribose deacetylase (regulator of RNase III)